MTLHDELRELVDTFGEGLLGDADQFRAALDDYLPENAALPGQLNVLYDAVRFGAYARCVELLSRGSDPMLAVGTAGDLLARDRGTTEVITSRWAVASLAHATGHLATDALSVFLQPDTAGGPMRDPAPSVPTPSGPPPGSLPPGPPPPYPPPQSFPPPQSHPPVPSGPPPTANPVPPPPTYVPLVETAPGTPPSWPTSEQPPEPAQKSTPAPPPATSEPVPAGPAAASSTPAQPQTVTAPLRRGPVSAPPGSSPTEPRRRSRRAGLIAAAAVAAVAAAGVGTYLVVANADDDDAPGPTAKDSAASSTPSSPTTSAGSTPPAPLTAPSAPKLQAAPAYRSVVFTVSGAVASEDGVVLEVASEDSWAETEPRFTIPTDKGGQRVCARVRGVRTDGDQSAPGPAARMCAQSKPTTIRWVRSDTGCPPAQGLTCYTFDLQVSGFEPGSSLTMEIVGNAYPPSSTFYPCEQTCTKKVKVNDTGRGILPDAVKAFTGSVTTLKVAGQQSQLEAPQ